MMNKVFVPYSPNVGSTLRDGSINPSWRPFLNAFNTWMEQAQSITKIGDSVYQCRVGNVVTITGTVGAGESYECLSPVVSFSHGSVLFSEEEGKMTNGGDEEVSLSVTYITKE